MLEGDLLLSYLDEGYTIDEAISLVRGEG